LRLVPLEIRTVAVGAEFRVEIVDLAGRADVLRPCGKRQGTSNDKEVQAGRAHGSPEQKRGLLPAQSLSSEGAKPVSTFRASHGAATLRASNGAATARAFLLPVTCHLLLVTSVPFV